MKQFCLSLINNYFYIIFILLILLSGGCLANIYLFVHIVHTRFLLYHLLFSFPSIRLYKLPYALLLYIY